MTLRFSVNQLGDNGVFISATTAYCTVLCHTMLLHLTMQWYRIMIPLNKALKEMLIAPMQGSFLTLYTPSSVISCASILFMGNNVCTIQSTNLLTQFPFIFLTPLKKQFYKKQPRSNFYWFIGNPYCHTV